MPSFGVCVAILNEQGKILLTKRNDLPVWCLPGGHIEAGETLTETAARETREETGLEITITSLVGIYSRPNWFDGTHEILFAARPTGGELRADGVETIDIGYFDPEDLPQPLLSWHCSRIQDAVCQEQAVFRCQDIRFPMAQVKREELYTASEQDIKLHMKEVVAAVCTPLPPENDRLELKGKTQA